MKKLISFAVISIFSLTSFSKVKDFLPESVQRFVDGNLKFVSSATLESGSGYKLSAKDNLIDNGQTSYRIKKMSENEIVLSSDQILKSALSSPNENRKIAQTSRQLNHLFFDKDQNLKTVVSCHSDTEHESLFGHTLPSIAQKQNTSCVEASSKACQIQSDLIQLYFPNGIQNLSEGDQLDRIKKINEEFEKHKSTRDSVVDSMNSEITKTAFAVGPLAKIGLRKSKFESNNIINTSEYFKKSRSLCQEYEGQLYQNPKNQRVVAEAKSGKCSSGTTLSVSGQFCAVVCSVSQKPIKEGNSYICVNDVESQSSPSKTLSTPPAVKRQQ